MNCNEESNIHPFKDSKATEITQFTRLDVVTQKFHQNGNLLYREQAMYNI